MKCKFCGNEVEEGAKFCPVCGTEAPQENGSADAGQSAGQYGQYEDPNKQPVGSQSGYSYGQYDNNQGGYNYGQPGDSYNQQDYGQPGDGYNQPNYGQPGDGYSQPNYGQPGGGYSQQDYGQPGDGYSQPNYGQPGGGYSQQDYGQSGNYYSQPNYGQPVDQINSTPYLVFSILSTICCCLPLGVVSIVYASKINSLQRMGDYEGAKNAARKAKIFCIASAVIGVIASVVMGLSGALDALDEIENDLGTSSIMSDSLDDDGDEYKEQDKDEEKPKQADPAAASEDLGDSWKSYTVQINNTVLTFPCSISEVEATGLTMDTETTPEDYIINRDDYELVFFDDGDYHSLMFVVSNNTEEARTVKECTVNGIYVNDYDVEEGYITVIFPGDIQIGTDINTVIEKWGEPDDFYEGDYADSYTWYEGDSLNCCMVSVDPETDRVITIDLDGQQLK